MSVYPVYAREPNIRGDNSVPTSSSWSNFDSPHARCHDICSCAGIPAQLPRRPPAFLLSLSVMTERHVERHVHANKRHVSVMAYHKRTTRPDVTHGPARSNLGAKTSLERASEDESRLNRAHAHVPTSDARCRPTRAALRCTLARSRAVLRLAVWAAASCVCCG
jgi:hypothetical protein